MIFPSFPVTEDGNPKDCIEFPIITADVEKSVGRGREGCSETDEDELATEVEEYEEDMLLLLMVIPIFVFILVPLFIPVSIDNSPAFVVPGNEFFPINVKFIEHIELFAAVPAELFDMVGLPILRTFETLISFIIFPELRVMLVVMVLKESLDRD